jgi:hypothetical protein
LGWIDGRNVRMDLQWGRSDINRTRALAQELVGLQPDIILTNGDLATVAATCSFKFCPSVLVWVTYIVISICPSRHQRIQSRLNHFSYVAIGRRQELSERSVQFLRRKHSPLLDQCYSVWSIQQSSQARL